MEISTRYLSVVLAVVSLYQAQCYSFFRDEIPNGYAVPHPCDQTKIWDGVGHLVEGGGNDRNPFGKDFKQAGKTWTRDLCMRDSDGDGRTNGEELGDTDCVWAKGETASSGATSHPGICEPTTSEACKKVNPKLCGVDVGFSCPAANENGTVEYTVRIPETHVPASETTYTCMEFKFPDDQDYHMVGFQEHIDNINVMHHIVVYGCTSEDGDKPLNQTYNCFMSGGEGCNTFIALWTLGQNGYCLHPSAGVKTGKSGIKRAILELHWNNPYKTTTYTDSSGVVFYLTPNLRQYNAGVAFIGERYLEIPPQEELYSVKGVCSPSCTDQLMRGPINVTGVLNHMHYLGKRVVSEVVHSGSKVEYLAYDETFKYDSPVFHQYQPIQVNPGDKLEIECTFNSMSRSKTTEWGFDTSAEMCYAFFYFYPLENFPYGSCVSKYGFDICERNSEMVRGCNLTELKDPTSPQNVERYQALNDNCAVGYCKKECKAIVQEIKNHACFEKNLLRWFRSESLGQNEDLYIIQRFYALLASCDKELYQDELKKQAGSETNGVLKTVHSWLTLSVIMAKEFMN